MVIDHHFDESHEGKPLRLVIPGGLIALGALGLASLVGYRGWISLTLAVSTAEYMLAGLAAMFIAGTFTFSYGYELYDIRKAMRLTVTEYETAMKRFRRWVRPAAVQGESDG